jgi:hypothetical protein
VEIKQPQKIFLLEQKATLYQSAVKSDNSELLKNIIAEEVESTHSEFDNLIKQIKYYSSQKKNINVTWSKTFKNI